MEKTALEQALDQLDQSVAAVRLAVIDLAHGGGADVAGGAAHALSGGAIDPFVFRFAIFVLAIFVGYYVVWSVTPALHTPLMAVTNAISSVIVVGALLAVGISASGLATGFGFVALTLASVNIFGGFLVTQRMLAMYKKKERGDARHEASIDGAVLVAVAPRHSSCPAVGALACGFRPARRRSLTEAESRSLARNGRRLRRRDARQRLRDRRQDHSAAHHGAYRQVGRRRLSKCCRKIVVEQMRRRWRR